MLVSWYFINYLKKRVSLLFLYEKIKVDIGSSFFVGGDYMNYYKVRYDSQLLAA